jgi:uncharacterized protein (UPF0332 family)
LTILNPDHLFDQARRLISPPQGGAPRQVDLRRAISAAYYGVFHFTLAAAADEFVGKARRASGPYALVYRSISHRAFKELCNDVKKPVLPAKYRAYVLGTDISTNLRVFAATAAELQEKRHSADYNPEPRFKTSEARFAITAAASAIPRFQRANIESRKLFLTLLICPPR